KGNELDQGRPKEKPGRPFKGRPGAVIRLWRCRSAALDAHGDPHAAADAERGEAALRVALLHLVEKGGKHARARGADRMAERYGAAVHVDLARVPAEVLVDGA